MAVAIDIPRDFSLEGLNYKGELLTEPEHDDSSLPRVLDLDQTLISSFQDLLALYRLKMKASPRASTVSSGGLQQFLLRKRKPVSQRCQASAQAPILLLPENAQLQIMSYLDTTDLCRTSAVCALWSEIANDNLLWKKKLERDMHSWETVGHATNPDLYEECQSDWSYKQMYLRCCPEVNQKVRQNNNNFHQLSSLLRSMWPRKTPKFAMLGPGLESSTSHVVRKIIDDRSGTFVSTGMFPGQFEGVGSGFTLRMSSAHLFHLITLYSNTKAERQNLQPGQRLERHRLIQQDAEHQQEQLIEIREPVKDLCRTLDGIVFAIDASEDADAVVQASLELHAMVGEMWMSAHVPLLVLSCVPHTSSQRKHSSIQVSRLLQLGKLNRPWQVLDCIADENCGIVNGFEWLVEQAQR